MNNKEQIIAVLGIEIIYWPNLTQLEQWIKEWVKRNGKCKDLIRFEKMIVQKGKVDENKTMKRITNRNYFNRRQGQTTGS